MKPKRKTQMKVDYDTKKFYMDKYGNLIPKKVKNSKNNKGQKNDKENK